MLPLTLPRTSLPTCRNAHHPGPLGRHPAPYNRRPPRFYLSLLDLIGYHTLPLPTWTSWKLISTGQEDLRFAKTGKARWIFINRSRQRFFFLVDSWRCQACQRRTMPGHFSRQPLNKFEHCITLFSSNSVEPASPSRVRETKKVSRIYRLGSVTSRKVMAWKRLISQPTEK